MRTRARQGIERRRGLELGIFHVEEELLEHGLLLRVKPDILVDRRGVGGHDQVALELLDQVRVRPLGDGAPVGAPVSDVQGSVLSQEVSIEFTRRHLTHVSLWNEEGHFLGVLPLCLEPAYGVVEPLEVLEEG
eukprot:CAMPEP_0170510322 /NCGR_PEP_ID=MMETSP0208-20121228/65704_1 /TAXON_ID=197538 /ORGANISM="Strombidium inclinatum, Strain S3" /LENGTH=132 /DNA_ID=CAMNT_0010793773 /DNA_START=446 /DNA_END=841 /DNA_ORIENTATION=-